MLDTSGLTGAGRWEDLIEQVLAVPPPYRAAPGGSVYVIHAGDRAVLVGEQDLTGPLRDLVTAILAAGGPAWRRREAGTGQRHGRPGACARPPCALSGAGRGPPRPAS